MQCQLLTPIILMLTLKIDKTTAYFDITIVVQKHGNFLTFVKNSTERKHV